MDYYKPKIRESCIWLWTQLNYLACLPLSPSPFLLLLLLPLPLPPPFISHSSSSRSYPLAEWQVMCIFKALHINEEEQDQGLTLEEFKKFYEVLDYKWTEVWLSQWPNNNYAHETRLLWVRAFSWMRMERKSCGFLGSQESSTKNFLKVSKGILSTTTIMSGLPKSWRSKLGLLHGSAWSLWKTIKPSFHHNSLYPP